MWLHPSSPLFPYTTLFRSALVEGDLADVVAVVENRDLLLLELEHRLHVSAHRGARCVRDLRRILTAQAVPLLERPAARQIAVDRVVRRGLIGQRIGAHAAAQELREHLAGVAEQADRHGLRGAPRALEDLESLVQRWRLDVEVAGLQARGDALGAAL